MLKKGSVGFLNVRQAPCSPPLPFLPFTPPLPTVKIHKYLNRMGLSDTKLFNEWRAKSISYSSKANAMLGEYALALDLAKRGIMLTAGVESLAVIDKNFKKLMVDCKQRIERAQKKEKKAAKAMFGGSPKKNKKNGGDGGKKEMGGVVASKDGEKAGKAGKGALDDLLAKAEMAAAQPQPKVLVNPPPLPEEEDDKEQSGGGNDTGEEAEEEEGLWEQHQEAIILAGITAVAVGAVYMFTNRRR